MTQSNSYQRVMLVAGEASGDHYAADVVKKLLAQAPDTHCYGMGLAEMRSAGVEMLVDANDLAVMGHHFIGQLPQLMRAYKKLTQTLQQDQPDVLVLIDYPDFNLRLAKFAHRLRTKVIYYISPKVWVWRRYRIKKIAQYVDELVVIYPFEKEIYRDTSLRVHYFGHPLVNDINLNRVQAIKDKLSEENLHILLLPGSRPNEIKNHLPALCEAASLLQKHDVNLRFSCVALPSAQHSVFEKAIKEYPFDCDIIDNHYSNLAQAHFAIACSGTATLQLALCQTPTLLIYQASCFYEFIFRQCLGLVHLGLPNIIMQHEVMQEITRARLDAEEICQATLRHIRHPEKMLQMQKDFRQLSTILMEQGNVSQQIAQLILSKFDKPTT
ncbi:MAG: lipid-A-disaccharide synthase [Candidatus Oxydemutatoraceae bacterium WSBS_2016_MAG_OTU14]